MWALEIVWNLRLCVYMTTLSDSARHCVQSATMFYSLYCTLAANLQAKSHALCVMVHLCPY